MCVRIAEFHSILSILHMCDISQCNQYVGFLPLHLQSVKMAGMYEAKTLDRVKRKLRQQAREVEGREQARTRAGSIDTLYVGTKVRNIPEFSLRVVTRPLGPGEW